MKRLFCVFGLILCVASLSGCLYGQCINGPCSLERRKILDSIKPYGEYWVKEGMSVAQRREDSWSCGAVRSEIKEHAERAADYVIFDKKKEDLAKRPEDLNDISAYFRLRDAWKDCMRSKGYSYEP